MDYVAVESPFAARPKEGWSAEQLDVIEQVHVLYARHCCRYVVMGGDLPLASHLYWTQFLDDTDAVDRLLGMSAGFDLLDRAGCSHVMYFYDLTDAATPGMQLAQVRHKLAKRTDYEVYLRRVAGPVWQSFVEAAVALHADALDWTAAYHGVEL